MAVTHTRILNFDVILNDNEIESHAHLLTLLKQNRLVLIQKEELPIAFHSSRCNVKFRDGPLFGVPFWFTNGFQRFLASQTAQVSNHALSFEKNVDHNAFILSLSTLDNERKDPVPLRIEVVLAAPNQGNQQALQARQAQVRAVQLAQMQQAQRQQALPPAPPPYPEGQRTTQPAPNTEDDDDNEAHFIDHLIKYLVKQEPSMEALRHYYKTPEPQRFEPTVESDHDNVVHLIRLMRYSQPRDFKTSQALELIDQHFSSLLARKDNTMVDALKSFAEESEAMSTISFLASIACFHNKEEKTQIIQRTHTTCSLLRQCPFFIETDQHASLKASFEDFDDFISFILLDDNANDLFAAADDFYD